MEITALPHSTSTSQEVKTASVRTLIPLYAMLTGQLREHGAYRHQLWTEQMVIEEQPSMNQGNQSDISDTQRSSCSVDRILITQSGSTSPRLTVNTAVSNRTTPADEEYGD